MTADNQEIVDHAKEALAKEEISREQYESAILLAMQNEADLTLTIGNIT